ncbi:MAG: type II toxin-antitoxin system ParD family antitoxin [Fimbriimonadaceae bacterium]|nr:type II toxin-antitoxin system ParD family antitoxin [Fimbriimonadaceae bacterium]
MPIEQMNVSLPPKMAKFIRGKVKAGQYTNASEVVRDAVRHMQEAEAARKSMYGEDTEAPLLPGEQESVRARVQAGIEAVDRGDYVAYDGKEGLERLRAKMIATVKSAARSGKKG